MADEQGDIKSAGSEAGGDSAERRLLPTLLSHGLAEALLDLLEDGIVVHDENRKILLINRTVEAVTGRSRDEILGKDCHEVFAPGGLCSAACAFKDHRDPHNEPRSHEVAFERPDGEVRHIRVKSTPIIMDQEARGVLAVIRDLSELTTLRWRLDKHREFHGMIGVSKAIGAIFETIRAVGPSDYPVLISGESGTGKELVAGAIHKESRRSAGPFVPVNCGALPENILESELFGHVRGAFTGAIRDKKGRFELADGGTIFLDEVGELPLHVQAKLLRVLQESAFERVGGEKPIKVDIRIVSATNRDLRQMVATGEFREDLFYRLCVVPIGLPPLRERREDIPYIAAAILAKVRTVTGKNITGIEDEAMSLIMAHPWRGNVRELINALQFASVLARGALIEAIHLPIEIRFPTAEPTPSQPPPFRYPSGGEDLNPTRHSKKLTREMVQEAIAFSNGNKVQAAKRLGVGRATLYRFFEEHPDLS